MAAVSAAMGRPFMPHQRHIVDVFLEVQSEAAGDPEPGEWAYPDGTATVERRGGKTSIITPLTAHRLRTLDRARVFMTAQTRDKARKRWMDATDDVLASPLRDMVRRKIGNMHEELRWVESGGLFVPFAPNEDGLHSETPDLVFVDELWAFDAEQGRMIRAGYVPAFATSGGQALKMSTQGTERSAWLNQVTRTGRAAVEAGTRLGVMYYEHSLPDRVDVAGKPVRLKALSDEQLVQACIDFHPAICHRPDCTGPSRGRPCPHGFTVRPGALRTAWTEMDNRSEFLRGYGNRSAADVASKWQAMAEARWVEQVDDGQIPTSARVALGVWVCEDGESAAIAAGWRDDLGRMHVEVTQSGDVADVHAGFRWVAARIARIAEDSEVSTVALPNLKESRDLADELVSAGLTVLRVAQADVAAACSRHKSELAAKRWFHRQSTEATAAAEAASWEHGRWGEPGDSIAALGAQTMAGWGADHAPPAPPKPTTFRIR